MAKISETPLSKYHQVKVAIVLVCLVEIGLYSASIAKGPPNVRPYVIWGLILSILTIFYPSFLRRVCDIPSAPAAPSSSSKDQEAISKEMTEGSAEPESSAPTEVEEKMIIETKEGGEEKKERRRYNQPPWAIYALHILPIGLWISAPCIPVIIGAYSVSSSRYSRRGIGRLGGVIGLGVYDLGVTKAAAAMAIVISLLFLINIHYLRKLRAEEAKDRNLQAQDETLS